jgi:hypothetical protein
MRSIMDYYKRILDLLKRADQDQLKQIYMFIFHLLG